MLLPSAHVHDKVHALGRISHWRISTLSELLSQLFWAGGVSVQILHVFLTGDNEYLCIEAGIPGGNPYSLAQRC
jgi:hypothetical protein